MLGELLVLIFCVLAAGSGFLICQRLVRGLDLSAQLGISGLVSLGVIGTILFFLGIVSVSMSTAVVSLLVAISGLVGWSRWLKFSRWTLKRPEGLEALFPIAIGLLFLMCLAGVFSPSTPNDWDSLAYHLAVPKMWLLSDKIAPIHFIHQSNFPFAIDSLYLVGLKWGGQSGAKMFVWCSAVFGAITLYGLARQRYGNKAGWWSALLFTAVPIVLWQAGTAYIDVPHGLYAGLGLIFVCWWLENSENQYALLGGIMLGLAAATKYTGLQTMAIAGLVGLVGIALYKANWKAFASAAILAICIAAPWYAKNVAWKENPVFPFFYSKLGGKDWDARRAEIYTREQNTFGVGRAAPPTGSLQLTRMGHSVLGLAYQPGRYVNPVQTAGLGDPMGAIGAATVVALLLGLVASSRGRFERTLLISILISLGIWFVLTQQSRYILALVPPLAMIAASLSHRRGFGVAIGATTAIQALVSLYLLNTYRFGDQMQVVAGKISATDFQLATTPFFEPAQAINKLPNSSKVALYDEVFGYFLNVPYEWANPGHSTVIPYDQMESGQDYVEGMRKLGFTHVLIKMIDNNRTPLHAENPNVSLGATMQATMSGQPFPEPYRTQLFNNWEVKFKILISEAAGQGLITLEESFGRPGRPPSFLLFKL